MKFKKQTSNKQIILLKESQVKMLMSHLIKESKKSPNWIENTK